MRKKMFLVLSSLCSFFCIQASGTHPFEVLDHASHDIPRIRLKFTEEAFRPAKFDKTELERGFRVTAVDMNNDWRLPFVYKGAEMDNSLKLLTARGEYTSCGFSLFAIKHLNMVKITFPTLKDGKGNTIDGKELSMLEIAPAGKIPRFEGAQLLYAPELKTIVADEQVNLLLMVNIPEKSVAGTYTGKIEISSNAGTAAVLNINLRVVDVILPEIGNFGFFINGNLYNPQIHKEERIMQKVLSKKLEEIFYFLQNPSPQLNITFTKFSRICAILDGQVRDVLMTCLNWQKAMNECNLNGNSSLIYAISVTGAKHPFRQTG